METLRPPARLLDVPLGGVASFSRSPYRPSSRPFPSSSTKKRKEFDRLERFSANILLPYPLDINIVYIISSLISSNVICLWFARQLESFSTDVKSSKIQDSSLESLKANTRVQSLINLFALTRRISNAMQISQVFKLRSFEFFLKKQNLDRFASLIGQYVNKKRSTKHDIRKTSRKQIGRCL